jgi:hypothetical protein
MLVLLIFLLAPPTDASRVGFRVARPDHGRLEAPRVAWSFAAHHEDKAASRRVQVGVATAAATAAGWPGPASGALYERPSLAPLTPSAAPSSQRDPPLSLG